MTTDLDALEARAKTRQAIDSPDVLTLIAELRKHTWQFEDAEAAREDNARLVDEVQAELRQERERAEGHKAAFLAASAERFEAGKARDAFHDKTLDAIYAMNAAQDALSRAEETIARIDGEVKNFEQSDNDAMCEIERILTEYGEQKERAEAKAKQNDANDFAKGDERANVSDLEKSYIPCGEMSLSGHFVQVESSDAAEGTGQPTNHETRRRDA